MQLVKQHGISEKANQNQNRTRLEFVSILAGILKLYTGKTITIMNQVTPLF